jgi:hypothetical protein
MKRQLISVGDAAAIAGVLAMASIAMGDIEPLNDTFPGETLPSDPLSNILIIGELDDRECGGGYGDFSVGLPSPEADECPTPDTLMRAWLPSSTTVVDDNSSPLGDGFASALYGMEPYWDYDYGLRAVLEVTGTDNMYWNHDFPHGELGRFEGFLTWRDADGASLGTATFDETFSLGTEIFLIQVFGVPLGTETYDVELNNDACQTQGCDRPDTFLGLFDETGALIGTDDDSSWAGNGTASMISTPLAGETLLEWKVTGTGNESFAPGVYHGQIGSWEMIVDFFGPDGWLGGPYIDDMPFVTGDEVFSGMIDVPAGADFMEMWIDNAIDPCPCDIDFYTITGLAPDGAYIVNVQSEVWMMVAWMDNSGVADVVTEGEPIVVAADDQGVLHLAATGGNDWDFMGWHEESGPYVISVSPDGPLPCNAADLAEPFGVLDLADIAVFVDAFVNQLPAADLSPDGIYDLADIAIFVDAFTTGCFR